MTMKAGTILIDRHALRPRCFHVEDDSGPNGWVPVQHNLTQNELEKELSTAGWTFFYLANSVKTTAFGFNRARMIDAALKRVIANVKQERCNCLEIDRVATHTFLGLPYVSVSAHPRHIQKGMVFRQEMRKGEER